MSNNKKRCLDLQDLENNNIYDYVDHKTKKIKNDTFGVNNTWISGSQVSNYLPSISILDLVVEESSISDNGINIKITFSVSGSDAATLEVSV